MENLWKGTVSSQFRAIRNYAETVPFHKISIPGNKVKMRYFTWCIFRYIIDTGKIYFQWNSNNQNVKKIMPKKINKILVWLLMGIPSNKRREYFWSILCSITFENNYYCRIRRVVFLNWDLLHARLNSHQETWSYKKRSTKILEHTKNQFRKNLQLNIGKEFQSLAVRGKKLLT